MNHSLLLKKVRLIEIRSRNLSAQNIAGNTIAMSKGRGMEFSEVRDYQYGDEIRMIDWNVTARFNAPFVKVFHEEKERVIMLMVDVSKSMLSVSTHQSKRETIIEVMATLAFSAVHNNDKVGVIFFSDCVERYIAPQKGKKHCYFIISEFLNLKPSNKRTDIDPAILFYTKILKKRTSLFILSDFLINKDFKQSILSLKRKHEVSLIQLTDLFEKEFPKIGLIELIDSETDRKVWIDTSNEKNRLELEESRKQRSANIKHFFSKNKLNFAIIETGEDSFYTLNHLLGAKK